MVNDVTENIKIITTKGDTDNWKGKIYSSYKAIEVNWRDPGEKPINSKFYANNPTHYAYKVNIVQFITVKLCRFPMETHKIL